MKLEERKKRKYLTAVISAYLKTNIEMMKYFYASTDDKSSKKICKKSILDSEEAIAHLETIKHIELLEYLYSTFIGNNVIAYSVSGRLVKSSKLSYWDTEKGFVDFQEEMKGKREKAVKDAKDREEMKEAIKKAREEGKKVEMVYDKETKKVRPVIIEENNNA